LKRGTWGFTELAPVVPGEVIAALEAVMAGNLMHGVAANAVLYLWGAESVLHLTEPNLLEQRHRAGAKSSAAVVNDRRTQAKIVALRSLSVIAWPVFLNPQATRSFISPVPTLSSPLAVPCS
jgi:hypothetical protein